MSKVYIYPIGAITGCNETQATHWRETLATMLGGNFVVTSPLRCEPIKGPTYSPNNDLRYGTPAAIGAKNRIDCQRADVVVANFPAQVAFELGHPSIGGLLELGWSIEQQKARIVISDLTYIVDNPVVRSMCPWILPEEGGLSHAVDIIQGIFGVYTL